MTRPLGSTRIAGLHRYYETARPCAPHRYSPPRGSAAWGSRFRARPRASSAPLAVCGRGTTGSPVPHRSPGQARATSMPDTAWPVGRLPPGSSQAVRSSLVSMSSVDLFDTSSVVCLRSPSWPTPAALFGATFPATLTTTALDRSSSGRFAASPCRAAAEDHRPNGRPLHLRCSTATMSPIFYIGPPCCVSCSHSARGRGCLRPSIGSMHAAFLASTTGMLRRPLPPRITLAGSRRPA
jgi:hypothetical protein